MDILIADDDLTTRAFLRLSLEKLGHSVVECENGSQVIEKFQQTDSPPLGIIDWTMPKKSGLEVVKELREHSNLISKYLILLSARSKHDDIVEGLEAGANDYIVKPFFYHELVARISIGVQTIQLQNEVSSLRELLPICSWCKAIKTDENYWESLENYLIKKMNANLTHGICSSCKENLKQEKKERKAPA